MFSARGDDVRGKIWILLLAQLCLNPRCVL